MTNVQQGRNVADRKYGHKVRCEREADICIPLPSIDKRELMPGQRKKKAQSNCAFRYSEILQGRA